MIDFLLICACIVATILTLAFILVGFFFLAMLLGMGAPEEKPDLVKINRCPRCCFEWNKNKKETGGTML